jgi:hypothetical protein
MGNGIALLFQSAKGFVFELEDVLRIKEVGLLKERVVDLVGTGIKGPRSFQGLAFGWGVSGHGCNDIYAVQ